MMMMTTTTTMRMMMRVQIIKQPDIANCAQKHVHTARAHTHESIPAPNTPARAPRLRSYLGLHDGLLLQLREGVESVAPRHPDQRLLVHSAVVAAAIAWLSAALFPLHLLAHVGRAVVGRELARSPIGQLDLVEKQPHSKTEHNNTRDIRGDTHHHYQHHHSHTTTTTTTYHDTDGTIAITPQLQLGPALLRIRAIVSLAAPASRVV